MSTTKKTTKSLKEKNIVNKASKTKSVKSPSSTSSAVKQKAKKATMNKAADSKSLKSKSLPTSKKIVDKSETIVMTQTPVIQMTDTINTVNNAAQTKIVKRGKGKQQRRKDIVFQKKPHAQKFDENDYDDEENENISNDENQPVVSARSRLHIYESNRIKRSKRTETDEDNSIDPEDIDAQFEDDDEIHAYRRTSISTQDKTTDSIKSFLSTLGASRMLNAKKEQELARLLKSENKDDREYAFNQFVTSNLRLVTSIARKYLNRGLDLEDLIEEGALGLMKAIKKFDYTLGHKFSTYAT